MDRRRIVFNKRTAVFLLLFLILLGVAELFGVNYIRQQTGKKVLAEQVYSVASAQEFAGALMDSTVDDYIALHRKALQLWRLLIQIQTTKRRLWRKSPRSRKTRKEVVK